MLYFYSIVRKNYRENFVRAKKIDKISLSYAQPVFQEIFFHTMLEFTFYFQKTLCKKCSKIRTLALLFFLEVEH